MRDGMDYDVTKGDGCDDTREMGGGAWNDWGEGDWLGDIDSVVMVCVYAW